MTGRLAGKVAIVFGAGALGEGWGNGKAAAALFAREGARVVAVDLVGEAAEETAGLIQAEGGEAIAVRADVTDPVAVAAAFDAAVARFGGIDLLLNNVGISGAGAGLFAHDEDVWDKVFATNVRSVFTSVRLAVPLMLARGGGAIVNVSSTSGLRMMGGRPSHAYAASKAAVIHLTRTVALEFARQGIRCNCVAPGMIDTPHASVAMRRANPDGADALITRRHAASPTGAQGTAWDVAEAALYLASAESAYVNGHTLVVDGGYIWSTPAW
jgi:NAD(P)-dependent dehydrogenase (short-subunit alcohol dehydrogenase family)